MAKRYLSCVMVLLLALGLATATHASVITIGTEGEAPGLDPRLESDTASFERINVIMEPLVAYNRAMELTPRLAVEWKYDPDEPSLRFWLREGVLFHHGREFTAHDVKYTFETLLDPDFGAPNRNIYQDIEEIEVINDYEVVFRLAAPNGFLINNMARMNIVPADIAEQQGSDFRSQPVGTGPYQFAQWQRDDRLVLQAFDRYWGGAPKVSEVHFHPIPEQATRLMALEGGELDIITSPPEMEFQRLLDEPNLNAQSVAAPGYNYLGFNTTRQPLENVQVRRAISHLINRDAIVEQLLYGLALPGVSQIPPTHPWYNDDVRRYEYSPEAASELLQEAGISPENPIQLELYVSQGNETWEAIAEILGYELAQHGIEVVITQEEWGAFLARIVDSDDYDMFLLRWVGQLDPDRASYRQFHSESPSNTTFFRNERVDELLERGRIVAGDSEESIAIYREVQEIVVDEVPYAFIFYTIDTAVSQDYVQNWTIHPYQPANFADIHQIALDR